MIHFNSSSSLLLLLILVPITLSFTINNISIKHGIVLYARSHDEQIENTSFLSQRRRAVLLSPLIIPLVSPACNAQAAFISQGFGTEEYTNSLTASRDTNISPKEAYETVFNQITSRTGDATVRARALDMGAGAGVSTQLLYEKGYKNIEAVDWSRDAWDKYVTDVPDSVNFYEMDDERYLDYYNKNELDKFDIICFHFAINESKAQFYASNLLTPTGQLLAPVNTKTNYWLKQQYRLYDSMGQVKWSSDSVGAWDVQFQPDVTQETCQGIWCGEFNGFVKMKKDYSEVVRVR